VYVEETEHGSEAGVMVREALEPDSPYAAVLATTDGRVSFRRRPIAGEDTDETTVDVGDLPVWVRIVRRRAEEGDDEVEGYVSIDGETWQLIGTDVISLSDAVHAGLVAASGSSSDSATAVADGFTLADLPDLYVSFFDAPADAAPGQEVAGQLAWGLSNIGGADAGPSRAGIYISSDSVITSADTLLVQGGHPIGGISAGSSPYPQPPFNVGLAIPETVAPGSYYIGVLMDDQGAVTESDETNNYKSKPITIVNKPDLYISSFTAAFASAKLGEAVGSKLSVQVGNKGPVDAGTFSVGVYLSSDTYITTADHALVNGQATIGSLAAGATTPVSLDPQAKIPTNVPPGTYYIAALADDLGVIDEVHEINNSMYKPTSVTIVGPDLIVDSFHCERGAAGPGQTLEDMLTLRVRNQGPTSAGACSVGIYLSTDQVITTADIALTAAPVNIGPLAANSLPMKVVVPASVAIPSGLATGNYHIGALIDTADAVAENNENNNFASQPIVITSDTWTIMGYFTGDCNREWQSATNLDQLELVNTAGTSINLIVLLDRNPKTGSGFWDAKIPSTGTDWSDTRWGTVTYDGKAWDGKTAYFATTLQHLDPSNPEKNTGDPATFTDYVAKAMALAPAQHYAIWFYDHGSMGGFGQDDTSGGDGLTMAELHSAFDTIPFVDIVLYDACLMQDIEVVTELIGDVGYVMASQSERWGKSVGSNIYVDKALNWLTKNQNATPEQLATQLLQHDMHAAGGGDASVVDMALVDNLNDAMENFTSVALNTASAAEWIRLREATSGVETFSPWKTYLDIWEYLDNVIKDTQISATIRSQAAVAHDLLDPIKNKVIIAQKGKGSGLSTYLPPPGPLHPGYNGSTYTYCNLLDKDGTHWREFLLKLPAPPSKTTMHSNFVDIDVDLLSDSFDEAEPVGIRDVPASLDSNINHESDVDMVKVAAQAGDVLYADLYGDPANGGLMPVLTIYGPDQDTVLAQAIGDPEGHASIPIPLIMPLEGEYYLAVTSAGNFDPLNPVEGETLGLYTLSLTWGSSEVVDPDLDVAETVADFGEVEVDSWSSQTIRLTNQGGTDLKITELTIEPEDSPFIVPFEAAVSLPIRVAAGGSFELSVGVNPQVSGPITHTLRVLSSDPDTPLQEIELRVGGLDVWEGSDIGDVEAIGSDFLQNGVWTIEASGRDISGTADEFHYVFQPLMGNGEIIARVTHVEGTHEAAKAGVMIRETLAADSAHATMVITPGVGASFQRRRLTGEESYDTTVAEIAEPYWVRLVRAGDAFTAYMSADGVDWQEVGTDMIDMPDTVYVGLAVTSHNDGLLCTAVLDKVAIHAKAVNWDIDDNGAYDALTDGLLIMRYLFGFRGEDLIVDAIGEGANRTTAAEVEAYLDAAHEEGMLDIDGNGADDALTDGLLIMRYLFGFRGEDLIRDAVAPDATRTTVEEIEAFIESYMPPLTMKSTMSESENLSKFQIPDSLPNNPEGTEGEFTSDEFVHTRVDNGMTIHSALSTVDDRPPLLPVAVTVHWDGGGDGTSWSDPLNWDTDTLPGADDDVIINVTEDPTVTIDGSAGNVSVNSIESHEALMINGGSVTSTGSQTYNGPVILGADTTLDGMDVTFAGTLDSDWVSDILTGPC